MPKRKRTIEFNLDPTERQVLIYVEPEVKSDLHRLWILGQGGFLGDVPVGKLNDLLKHILRLGIAALNQSHVTPIENMTIGDFIEASTKKYEEVANGGNKDG